jgi:hypothetical protein
MDKVLVAELGVEGGGCSVYGREAEGSWSFWREGSSLDFDEDDEEVVRSWATEPVPDLWLAVPKEWPLYYVLKVHPDFRAWFREKYESARASLDPSLKETQAEHIHPRWAEILGLPG